MNQTRDPSKPTWKVGVEFRIPVGGIATLNRSAPGSANKVGRGVHEFRAFTSITRSIGWAAPFFELAWLAPFAVTEGSPFADPGFGAARSASQQQAQIKAGVHVVAWRNPRNRLVLGAQGELAAHFEGRAYTEMWEVFQYAGTDANAPLRWQPDPTGADPATASYPGVSKVENYLRFAGQASADWEFAEWGRVGLSFDVEKQQDHRISFADPGVDGSDDNDVVDPGTEEVNPLYKPLIDSVGHRYGVSSAFHYTLALNARVLL